MSTNETETSGPTFNPTLRVYKTCFFEEARNILQYVFDYRGDPYLGSDLDIVLSQFEKVVSSPTLKSFLEEVRLHPEEEFQDYLLGEICSELCESGVIDEAYHNKQEVITDLEDRVVDPILPWPENN